MTSGASSDLLIVTPDVSVDIRGGASGDIMKN
jgi:hypothetical protein